jgi:hypothetical protein
VRRQWPGFYITETFTSNTVPPFSCPSPNWHPGSVIPPAFNAKKLGFLQSLHPTPIHRQFHINIHNNQQDFYLTRAFLLRREWFITTCRIRSSQENILISNLTSSTAQRMDH